MTSPGHQSGAPSRWLPYDPPPTSAARLCADVERFAGLGWPASKIALRLSQPEPLVAEVITARARRMEAVRRLRPAILELNALPRRKRPTPAQIAARLHCSAAVVAAVLLPPFPTREDPSS